MKTEKKAESASALAARGDAAKRKLADATADAKQLKTASRQAKRTLKKARKTAKAAAKAARAAREKAEDARRAYEKAFVRAEKARAKAAKQVAKARPSAPTATPRKASRPRHVAPRTPTEPAATHAGVDFEASFSDTDLKALEPQ
jgi:hypothetical protein